VYKWGIYNFAPSKKIQVRFLLHVKLSVKFFTFVHGLSYETLTGKHMLDCFLPYDDVVPNHLLVVCVVVQNINMALRVYFIVFVSHPLFPFPSLLLHSVLSYSDFRTLCCYSCVVLRYM